MVMVGRGLLVAALCATGCRATGVFDCVTDEQCRHGATFGRCESVGYCSFGDTMCTSGSRFDDNAGAGYAGECVGEEMPTIDAAIDSPPPPFDPMTCPLQYARSLPSTQATARYRLITAQATFWVHEAECNGDMPGATHLVMPKTTLMETELSQWIDPLANTGATFYVGAVQDPAATMPAEGFIFLDNTPVPAAVWIFGEPDDEDNVENQGYSLAFYDKTPQLRRMFDSSGNVVRGAICECDGVPISAMAQAWIAADPNHPP